MRALCVLLICVGVGACAHRHTERPPVPQPPPKVEPPHHGARPPTHGEGPTAAPVLPEKNARLVEVFYATDRARAPLPAGYTYASTRRNDESLELGRFKVSIPRDHREAVIERPTGRRLEFTEDPDQHFVIVDRHVDTYDDFYRLLANDVDQSRRREAFVFIHGFNVAFDDAIYRTAQMAYDMGFDGPPILYSWPSEGGVRNYTHDKTTNELTIPNLRWFLEDVVKRSHASVVHVIAHSMGTYALVRALEQMQQDGHAGAHLNSIILAAPDIDARVFTQLSSTITRAADRVVLYASSHDVALLASKELNGGVRAGDVGPVTVLDGIDTVDASDLKTDFIGHSYFGDHESVIGDIRCVLQGTQAERRWGLEKIPNGGRAYWRFVSSDALMACMANHQCACGLPQ